MNGCAIFCESWHISPTDYPKNHSESPSPMEVPNRWPNEGDSDSTMSAENVSVLNHIKGSKKRSLATVWLECLNSNATELINDYWKLGSSSGVSNNATHPNTGQIYWAARWGHPLRVILSRPNWRCEAKDQRFRCLGKGCDHSFGYPWNRGRCLNSWVVTDWQCKCEAWNHFTGKRTTSAIGSSTGREKNWVGNWAEET